MSVPTDLVDPTALRDPVEEFFRQGGIDPYADANNSESQAKKVALIGTALAAAFIVYRTLMHKELDEVEPPSSKGAAMKLIAGAWGRTAAPWQRAALPAAIRAYQLGQTSLMTDAELETLAGHYVSSLGEYMHTTSAQALADGFQAQLNKGWSKEVAWVRSVYGYGLDDTQTRQYLKSFAEGAKSGYVADPIPAASRKVVDVALSTRAKRFGDTEAWSAVETGKNVVWLYKVTTGELPVGMKKRWDTAHDEKVCPVCGPLDGKTILVEKRFHTSDGKKVYAPGIHPNCRCKLELVYPENRVDELVRKNRPGDPYNRDKDGQFSRKESRGWTYREAADDHEKEHPHYTRARQRVLEAEKPSTQTTSNPFEKPVETAKPNPFGVVTNPFARTSANPFGSANPFATETPVQAAAPVVRRQVIVVVTPQGNIPISVTPPPPDSGGGPPPLPDPEPIGPMAFSQEAAIANNIRLYSSDGSLKPLTDDFFEPELGDTITFGADWDDDGTFVSDYGVMGVGNLNQQIEDSYYEERRRLGADSGDNWSSDAYNMGEVDEGSSADEYPRVITVFIIENAMGYKGDGTQVPTGQYMVTDVEEKPPSRKDRAAGATAVREVTLDYFNHTPRHN